MVAVSLQPVLGPAETERLAGTRFGDVRWVAGTGSTNADLLALARDGAPEGVVLVADHQTAGRGRQGRTWEAPAEASLLVSVLLRPDLAVEQAHLVTMAAGLAAADACAPAEVALKWPNDLLAGNGKLAGVLAESVLAGGRVAAVVVGMGLNVNWPAPLPEGVSALNQLIGHDVDRAALLADWLVGLDRRLDDLGPSLVEEYRRRCSTIGRRVRVELASSSLHGTALDVTDDGRLVLDTGDVVSVGDVVHLRTPSGVDGAG